MGLLARGYERLRSLAMPYFGRSRRSELVDAIAEHYGKQYLRGKRGAVSYKDIQEHFTEQKSIVGADGQLHNQLNRLNYNRLYYHAKDLVRGTVYGPESNAERRSARLEDIIGIIMQDAESFRKHFVEGSKEGSEENKVHELEKQIISIAKANPDKDGYFSVPGFMEKQQVGRSKVHRKLKLEYARQAIDRWADSLNAPDFDYLSTDHLRTMPGHDPDGKRAEPQERALAFINQARSDEFRDNLYRKLIPRITAKEYAYDLEDTLSDLKSCVTGAGKKDGFTKPVAKKILEVLGSKRIRNSEDLDHRIQAAKEELGRMDNFKELDVYFTRKNAPLAQEQYSAVTINTSEGRKEISINARPATLLDWAEQCIKAEYALEQHNRFYFGKQGSGKHGAGRTVEERIDKFNKTAINPAESTQAVEFNYENLRRRFPTSSAYDKAIGQKHTYKARSTIKKEKERIFIEISKELRPEDRSQLKKTPSERIDTAITQFYQQDADDSLKQKVEDYVALTKLLDYVDNAGTNGMYDRMRCSLQDTFSRAKARISGKVDACPEVYRE